MKDWALGEGGGWSHPVTDVWRNEIAHKGGEREGSWFRKIDGDGLSV